MAVRDQEQLAQLYIVEDQATVAHFLDAHPFLVPLLAEARQAIATYFPAAPLYLEVVVDPETNDHPQLVLTISPTDAPDAALARHQELKNNWWVPNLHRAYRALIIVPEYR